MTDLAKRAVACRHWRWMPVMLLFDGKSSFTVPISWRHGTEGQRAAPILGSPMFKNALPDLTDPATVGCLLALVREAWGDSAAHAVPDGDWHIYGDMPETEYAIGDTEAEVLVAALEAAP